MTGGSAATFYTELYCSRDVDFVLTFGSGANVPPILSELGFEVRGSHYVHPRSAYTLDFPPGPLAVGNAYLSHWETVHRGDFVLHVLSRTDSVRDRLTAFFHWNDLGSLLVALAVAQSGPVDLELIRAWSVRETAGAKFEEFERRLKNPQG